MKTWRVGEVEIEIEEVGRSIWWESYSSHTFE